MDIPAGVDSDQILSMANMGNYDQGQRGDLLLRLSVSPHPVFSRNRNDILSTIEVDLQVALLGGSVRVETIHGVVDMKINAGTQPGDVKRLAGRGIHSGNSRKGDHLVTISVKLPRSLSEEQRKLLQMAFGGANGSFEQAKKTEGNENSFAAINDVARQIYGRVCSWLGVDPIEWLRRNRFLAVNSSAC